MTPQPRLTRSVDANVVNRARHFCLVAAVCAAALSAITPVHADDVRTLTWTKLMPPGWMPKPIDYKRYFKELSKGGDPAVAQEEDAPVVLSLNKQHVRLVGFMVISAWDTDPISDVFLVPYFGACIHVPPPPSNQMVLIHLDKPMKVEDVWNHGAVWVTGILHTDGAKTDIAAAGYSMKAEQLEPYDENAHKDSDWYDARP